LGVNGIIKHDIAIVESQMSNDECLTMSVPEAGWRYYGLCRNASYDAARRGEIPVVKVGRLWRVPKHLMARKLEPARQEGGAS
jgi:hypothetical protein